LSKRASGRAASRVVVAMAASLPQDVADFLYFQILESLALGLQGVASTA